MERIQSLVLVGNAIKRKGLLSIRLLGLWLRFCSSVSTVAASMTVDVAYGTVRWRLLEACGREGVV